MKSLKQYNQEDDIWYASRDIASVCLERATMSQREERWLDMERNLREKKILAHRFVFMKVLILCSSASQRNPSKHEAYYRDICIFMWTIFNDVTEKR